jgi:cytochrome c oxidase subunit II
VKYSIIMTILVALLSAVITPASRTADSRRIEIDAKRFRFAPNEVTVQRGEPVVLVFKSDDVTHGLKIDELGLNTEIHKGQTTEVPLTADLPGTFEGKCSHFCGQGHGHMTFAIHVAE